MTDDRYHILIVDDDEVDRTLLIRTLRRAEQPAVITEANSLNDALDHCARQRCDCLFIDYRLPGETGLSAVASLHRKYPYLPIIMVTGQGDEMLAVEALKCGVHDYIPKENINPHSLSRALRNAIERVRLQRKLEEQREALQSFARILAHDLKAPTRIIRGFLQLIEKSIQEGNFARTVEYFEHVIKAAGRMDALIDALAAYTRLDGEANFESLSMHAVLEDALANLEEPIAQRRARVTHGELPRIVGNGAQLTQLLQNLIGNGIKYCEAETPAVHVAAEPHGENEWRFSVTDNGIGIPEEQHLRIFEPFTRLHNDSQYPGTGLGLAACKKAIERHNGGIWCERRPQGGTVFYFTLPKQMETTQPAARALPAA